MKVLDANRTGGKTISREMIRAEAAALFRERGVQCTSVNDIVKRTGIAKGTFYLYFRNKEDLINAVFEECIADFARTVAAPNSGDPTVKDFARSILAFFRKNRLFLSELRKNMHSDAVYAFTRKTLAEFSGLILAYLNLNENYPIKRPETYAHMIIGMILEICHRNTAGSLPAGEARVMLEDFLKRFFDCKRISP